MVANRYSNVTPEIHVKRKQPLSKRVCGLLAPCLAAYEIVADVKVREGLVLPHIFHEVRCLRRVFDGFYQAT